MGGAICASEIDGTLDGGEGDAGGEADEEHEGAGAEDLPAEGANAGDEVGERVGADFVGGGVEGIGVEAFGEEEVRGAVERDAHGVVDRAEHVRGGGGGADSLIAV